MAKKYGVGATAGKKASTYVAEAPDGTRLKKKSFFIHSDKAFISAYYHGGKWKAAGVTEQVRDWGSQHFFEATKIK